MKTQQTNLLNCDCLGSTLDAVSEALFFGVPIPVVERRAVAKWIATRQGLPGAYADTFAPTEKDTLGIHLFTGEAIRTLAGTAHILGEESCRVLHLLNVKDRQVQEALTRAVRGLAARLDNAERRGASPGFYCCGACAAAYWRNLATGQLPRSEERLRSGLVELTTLRAGGGKWRRFPFFYTCLVLTEIGPNLAKAEMQCAALYWQRNLKKLSLAKGCVALRRTAVGQRLLELCES
ncbi:MAG TPA: hypothetical protein P5186_08830 [Candidatus Paceibacterota bacterium]|nr:hypothetical protein [Verrucomicrobiota bacterium]HRY48137.1 hypothetical protein [Candidatus Paceibacterota bacterium]HRZ57122.1 hypothetical protein [Candidatus Paceibacterota bacterium]